MAVFVDRCSLLNQENIQERLHRVRLMKAVYSSARTVRVWPEAEVDLESKPFRVLRRLKGPSTDSLFNGNPSGSNLCQTVALRDYDSRFWETIFQIFDSPYWKRIWTQQELYLAQNIQFYLPRGTLAPNVLIHFENTLLYALAGLNQPGALDTQCRCRTSTCLESLF